VSDQNTFESWRQPYQFDEKNEKDVASIYRQIAVHPDSDFDVLEKTREFQEMLRDSLDKESLMLDPAELAGDVNKLNLTFVTYIKHCASKGAGDVGFAFTVFCDHYDMEYAKAYERLHDKLKALVVRGLKRMIGTNEYKKFERRANPDKPRSLFDLYGGGADSQV
jgi:hypothetical protein